MTFRNVTAKNPLKRSLQDALRHAEGLPAGRGRVTCVQYDATLQEARGCVHAPRGMMLRGRDRAVAETAVHIRWHADPVLDFPIG